MFPLLSSTQSFYFSTLEEYYTGGLFLGIGNGVTDGSLAIIVLFCVAGFFGTEIFRNMVSIELAGLSFKLTVVEIMAFLMVVSQAIAVLMK